MPTLPEAVAVLDSALSGEPEDLYVPPGSSVEVIEADLRAHLCQPFQVHAKVLAPGFPFAAIGEELSGLCIAKRDGYWLVYQSEQQRFLCFWGTSVENLGAHGVYGNPLYCWAA